MMRSEAITKTNVRAKGSSHGLRDDSLVEAAKSGHSMASPRFPKDIDKTLRAAHRITRNREDAERRSQERIVESVCSHG